MVSCKKKSSFFPNKLSLVLLLFHLFFSPTLFAAENLLEPKEQTTYQIFSSKNIYQPYFELGGAKYFHQSSSVAGIYDLFIPLLQQDDQLLFTDLRIFDRSGTQCEGNLHLGFRKLFPESNQMFGIYGSFDLKKSVYGNNFKQITFGLEYWLNKFFVGGNFYKPIGTTTKSIPDFQESMFTSYNPRKLTKKTSISFSQKGEKALTGVDAEIGYAVTERLTGYVGGYYFDADDVNKVAGPKARITYDYLKPHGRILKIFDGVGIELGGQHDNQIGNSGYVEVKFKIGLTNFTRNSNVQGFARHMVELVRRDQDIVVEKTNTPQVIQTITLEEKPMERQDFEQLFGITKDTTLEELAGIHQKILKAIRLDNTISEDVFNQYEKWMMALKQERGQSRAASWKLIGAKTILNIGATILGWLPGGGEPFNTIIKSKVAAIADYIFPATKTEIAWDKYNYINVFLTRTLPYFVLGMFLAPWSNTRIEAISTLTFTVLFTLGGLLQQVGNDLFGRTKLHKFLSDYYLLDVVEGALTESILKWRELPNYRFLNNRDWLGLVKDEEGNSANPKEPKSPKNSDYINAAIGGGTIYFLFDQFCSSGVVLNLWNEVKDLFGYSLPTSASNNQSVNSIGLKILESSGA